LLFHYINIKMYDILKYPGFLPCFSSEGCPFS
jgi:hypothetical protein